MRRAMLGMMICTLGLAGCADAKVREKEVVLETEYESKMTIVSEERSETEQSVLEEEEPKQEVIEAFDFDGSSQNILLLEEVTKQLDAQGIKYEGYYSKDGVRADLTLEDGTAMVFLKTQDTDGTDIGYELVMYGDDFYGEIFQEHYLHAYDVITDDYYYPDLSKELLTEEELNHWNQLECSIVRNELFAKRGRKFEDAFLSNIFSQKSWYHPKYEPKKQDAYLKSTLTQIEKANLNAILEYEKHWKEKCSDNAVEVKALISGSWIDLDADGAKEQIIYQTYGTGDVSIFAQDAILFVNEMQIEYKGCNTFTKCYVASMDGIHDYLIIGENGMSGDPMVTFYKYKDKQIENLGEMYAYPYDLEMSGESIIAPEETCHLQCQPVKFRYELVDGSFVKQEEEYYDYRQNIITAKQEVALYTSKEETQAHMIIQEGEEVQVMGGDMKNWVLLRKVSTKEEGWLRVEYANCILPDGSEIYSQDLFEDIYMYG